MTSGWCGEVGAGQQSCCSEDRRVSAGTWIQTGVTPAAGRGIAPRSQTRFPAGHGGTVGRRRQKIGLLASKRVVFENPAALARLLPQQNADYPLRGRSLATPLHAAETDAKRPRVDWPEQITEIRAAGRFRSPEIRDLIGYAHLLFTSD